LGKTEARRLLGETLGYGDLRVPDSAFDRDTTFEQAVGFVERLGRTASGLGLGLGVKLTNTLIVENHRDFFPKSEREMYLSGPPLHVLAMHLVHRFRRQFGDRYPISFAAGIERANFPDAVALGLVPITVCSDLLKPGGYARARGYFQELAARMDAAGAARVGDFIIRAYGLGAAALGRLGLAPGGETRRGCDEALAAGGDLRQAAGEALYARWVSAAKLLNTEVYVERATADPRYTQARNTRLPRKIGSHLKLFDCISCDKCIPVCPNDANFTFVLPRTEIPVIKLRREAVGGAWRRREEGSLAISESHQIGNFADFCNDCGNCDVFCPEDGGPYLVKPRFFGTREGWHRSPTLDGFYVEARADGAAVLGRFAGAEYEMEVASGRVSYSGEGFRLAFEEEDPVGSVAGEASSEVDLTYFHIMNWLRKALLAPSEVNYVSALW
ncbi:MAG: glutamate synthase, partial [Gemmatimonadetes bacterium]|nr:glutamate synthase [Gemmatimonadota bacterium]